MKKVLIYIAVVIVVLVFTISARAETKFEIPVSECEIWPTIYETMPASIIEFDYNGAELSFIWTGTIKCWKTFIVTINEHNECTYARYKEFTVDDFIDGCNRN